MTHDTLYTHQRRRAAQALASTWEALCCLPATNPRLWLVRSSAFETFSGISLVLLDAMSVLVDAFGQGALHRG